MHALQGLPEQVASPKQYVHCEVVGQYPHKAESDLLSQGLAVSICWLQPLIKIIKIIPQNITQKFVFIYLTNVYLVLINVLVKCHLYSPVKYVTSIKEELDYRFDDIKNIFPLSMLSDSIEDKISLYYTLRRR